MSKMIYGLLIGLVIGAAIAGFVFWKAMPSMMFEIEESKLPFDETVAEIEQAAIEAGWQVPKIYDIKSSLNKAGYAKFGNLKILSMCQPHHAYSILSDDANKMVSSMMPCRIGVYEDYDGRVLISRMNVGLMSKMFGGSIEKVMGAVGAEQARMLSHILAH